MITLQEKLANIEASRRRRRLQRPRYPGAQARPGRQKFFPWRSRATWSGGLWPSCMARGKVCHPESPGFRRGLFVEAARW